jgi:hypothetical protein
MWQLSRTLGLSSTSVAIRGLLTGENHWRPYPAEWIPKLSKASGKCGRSLRIGEIGRDIEVCQGFEMGLERGIQHGPGVLVCHPCLRWRRGQYKISMAGLDEPSSLPEFRAFVTVLCAECSVKRVAKTGRVPCICNRNAMGLDLCAPYHSAYTHRELLKQQELADKVYRQMVSQLCPIIQPRYRNEAEFITKFLTEKCPDCGKNKAEVTASLARLLNDIFANGGSVPERFDHERQCPIQRCVAC